MRRVRSRIRIAGSGAIVALSLSACVDEAGTGASSATTLAPLVQSSFVTLPPVTTTSIVAPITAAPLVTAQGEASTAGSQSTTTLAAGAETDDTTATDDTTESSGTAGTGGTAYEVVSGDTIYGIATDHGISAQALVDFNGWASTSHSIFPGDTIQIPPGATATATTAATGSGATTTTAGASTGTTIASSGTYTVVAGDYLAGIAAKVGTTVDAIVAVNGWTDGADHLIIAGQTIKLPAKAG